MRYDPIFRYRGTDRRLFKRIKGYIGNVNDHHVIPKQHHNHPLLKKIGYDINGRFNILIMPIKIGIYNLNLHPNTIYHGPHPKYNEKVKRNLDEIYTMENNEYQLWLYVCWLKKILTDI